jgi:phosphatidylglycerol:prolipoprotein diacylglycerol transferase
MRVILFQTEDFVILSYPVMLLLAIVAALGTLAWRAGRSPIDHTSLLIPLAVAVIVGWLGSRLAAGLIKEGPRGFSLRLLLPTEHVSGSFSIFLAIAIPVLMLGLWRQRTGVLACLDVFAPSALAAFAVAKVGCLLAGCCAGGECPPGWGIRYPYGSRPYALQVATGTVKPPEVLLNKDENGATHLFGHIDFLRAVRRAPPDELTRHAGQYTLTYAEMLRLAESERSAPVWPVPLFYSVSAALLWLVAETVFAHSRRAGWTTAMVLTAYAAMRLGFDLLLAEQPSTGLGTALARSAALVSLIGGISLACLCMLGKTPERVLKSQI